MDNIGLRNVAIRRSPIRPWSETLALVSELYSFFGAQDVPKLAATRIRTYRDAFETFRRAAETGVQLGRDEAEDVIETMVEFEQLRIIMDAAKNAPSPSIWREQLQKLASGPTFGTDETKAVSPRDSQFECFLAAVAARGGYEVTFAEPDVFLKYEDLSFGIAAKRLRSLSSLEKNCRKAARQITKSGRPGVIALDLTHPLHLGRCLTPPTRDDAIAFAQSSVGAFLEPRESLLHQWVGGRALALLATVHIPAIIGIPEKPQLMTAVAWHVYPLTNGHSEITWLAAFAKRCINGLFGPRAPEEPPFGGTA